MVYPARVPGGADTAVPQPSKHADEQPAAQSGSLPAAVTIPPTGEMGPPGSGTTNLVAGPVDQPPESGPAMKRSAARPVYKRPWFLRVMAAAGAVVISGVVVGAVLGTRGPGLPENIEIQNWSLWGPR